MKHSKVRARLSGYLERDLSPGDRSRVSAHLADCPGCTRELRELEGMRRLLRRLPEPEVPPAFTESVMARVRAGEAEPPSVVRWLRRLAEPALAVPAAAAFAAVVVLVMQGGVVEPPSAGLEPAATLRVATVVADQAEPVAQEEEVDPAEDRHQYVREMQRRSLALRMARRGRPMEVARILRGAGHPYSPSFASHFEERDHPSVAAATWSPR